jgi:hypothetical protein
VPNSAPTKTRSSVKWPSPYEWASLALSLAALILSALGYMVSKQSEEAQQEHVAITCEATSEIEFISNVEDKYYLWAEWVARIDNDSRNTTITIVETRAYYYNSAIGESSREYFSGSGNTAHTDHEVGDRNFSLESGKSTTIRLIGNVPISSEAAKTEGVSNAKTIADADRLLAAKGIDIFGNRISKMNAYYDAKMPFITVEFETARHNSARDRCEFSLLEWVLIP